MRNLLRTAFGMLAGAVLAIVLIMAYNARAQDAGTVSTIGEARTSVVVDGTVAVNPTFQYQGVLLDPVTGQPKNGTFNITFNLYNSANTFIWQEVRSVVLTPGASGMFSLLLGQVNPLNAGFFNGENLTLGVSVNGEAEMTPRLPLARVPYAINADQVGGKTPDNFANYRTGAFAYGVVGYQGDKKSGYHFSVDRWSPAAGAYLLQLKDTADTPINFDPAQYVMVVTSSACPNNAAVFAQVKHTSSDPDLSPFAQVQMIERVSGNAIQCGFSFAAFYNPN